MEARFVVTLGDAIGLGILALSVLALGGLILVGWVKSLFAKSEPDEPESIEGIGTWNEKRGKWEK